jgi:hypothetical protein
VLVAEPTIENPSVPIPQARRSLAASWLGRERLLRLAPALTVIVGVGLVAAGQVAEDLADSGSLQMLSPGDAIPRWTVIVAVLYMLVVSRFVDRLVGRSLDDLEVVLKVHPEDDPNRFHGYQVQLGRPGLRVDGILFIASAVVVAALFSVLGTSLPIDDPVTNQPMLLPTSGVGALLVLAEYTVVGWAVLSLVASTIRRAQALGQLSREELEIDVFDTTKLLPFGNIALATALAPAGIIVILLFGFGRPSAVISWSVLLLATSASLLALILPLRGIHRQMAQAKQTVLGGLNLQVRKVYEQDHGPTDLDAAETARLNNRVTTLIALRKTVGEMTTWPFRDTLAFGRAVLIASAPLIYTVISELIKVIWINPLAG